MIMIGLTGSIGMGKTQTAALFAEYGIPVFDADAEVHKLYAKGGAAVPAIANLFPDAVRDGAVDRDKLAAHVLNDAGALARLEAVVHPLVAQRQRVCSSQAKAHGADIMVLDIPLLFENKRQQDVDVVVVVSAPPEVQRARVLQRPGMTAAKLDAIMAKQVPDAVKRRHADFVVETDQGVDHARAQVQRIIASLKEH